MRFFLSRNSLILRKLQRIWSLRGRISRYSCDAFSLVRFSCMRCPSLGLSVCVAIAKLTKFSRFKIRRTIANARTKSWIWPRPSARTWCRWGLTSFLLNWCTRLNTRATTSYGMWQRYTFASSSLPMTSADLLTLCSLDSGSKPLTKRLKSGTSRETRTTYKWPQKW